MRFGEVETSSAEGKILAHSIMVEEGRIQKGTVLSAEHVASIAKSGTRQLIVASMEEGEIGEDEAARRVATALRGEHLRLGGLANGRANLFASKAGLFRVDATGVDALNAIDPSVTLATLPDRDHVEEGRLVATVKVIPFAAREDSVLACEERSGLLRVDAYQGQRVMMIQTRLATLKEKVLDKTLRVTKRRVAQCSSTLVGELRCDHDTGSLTAAINEAVAESPDILLVSVASAVCDELDVLPESIRQAGGEVRSVGMPVDPGNLLVLGRIGTVAVIGLPGCARSPKPNGFDWILRRLCAGECVSAQDVSAMGVGGLLGEIYERRQRRVAKVDRGHGSLAAILLAAGLSSRMKGKNKLLEEWRGKPLVRHAAEALAKAKEQGLVEQVMVVTGNDKERIEETIGGLGLEFVHNGNYESGMGSSLSAGIEALEGGVSAALICLGDMPSATMDLLGKLAEAFDPADGKDIVVPVSGPRRGHPVLFGARHFADLIAIEGDSGARSVISRNEGAVVEVEAGEEALLDLDDSQAFLANA